MKRLSLVLVLALLTTVLSPVTIFTEATPIKIAINGQLVEFNETSGHPFVDENNRTQVPFRVILETFGANVSWEPSTSTAIAHKDSIKVEVPIGEKYVLKNGEKIENDTSALIKDGKSYLPIRKVMEAFGCEVGWDGETGTVVITKDKNPYTQEYLQYLVDNTECDEDIMKFRTKSNPRRKGLLKIEGKYFDMYYPNDEEGKTAANFLAPHMDKVYMMLTDLYGVQAEVEVHLIHEEDTKGLQEGSIREKEKVTFIWLEEGNDEDGNNLSEFVHEINHNFFSKVNGGTSNTMWINEANAKLIPSIYIKYGYDGPVDMWNLYSLDMDARNLYYSIFEEGYDMTLKDADKYLKVAKAWGRADGEKRVAQRFGLYFWSYVYNNSSFSEFKNYLRNLGTDDVIDKVEELFGKTEDDITKELIKYIKGKGNR